ncbi:MAG: ribosome silencing factor [Bowdeniella nasicola]|nr:ribosome silencing factor [Bowdeniella nasicola]
MPTPQTTRNLIEIAARGAVDKLATTIVALDVSDRLPLTDAFLIATGANERQVKAIVDEVEHRLAEAGVRAERREGYQEARWVLVDFGDLVVHVQHAEEREYYALERLWHDCPLIDLPDDVREGARENENEDEQ